jgi:ABC-type nickel/cobalt efflux system permease component RcnA
VHNSGYKTTALLGLAIGLLPCPSALAAYLAGLSTGNAADAYLMIAVFAAGIAFSLTVVGLVLQHASHLLHSSGRERTRASVWTLARALVILGIGLVYCGRVVVQQWP